MSATTDLKIAALEARIAELEAVRQEAITPSLSEGLVQHIAGQIQVLFRNPVMLSGITSALLQNIQNALMFRAGHSKDRQAQLIINDYYVPGSQRISINADGSLELCTQKLEEGVDPVNVTDGEWEKHVFAENDASEAALVQLINSYGVGADVHKYLITDIDLQLYRESLSKAIDDEAERRAREMALVEKAE